MARVLEKAFEEAKTLPEDRREQIGQWVRDYVAQERSPLSLSETQQAEVRRRLAEPKPVYATDDQVAELLRRFAAR